MIENANETYGHPWNLWVDHIKIENKIRQVIF